MTNERSGTAYGIAAIIVLVIGSTALEVGSMMVTASATRADQRQKMSEVMDIHESKMTIIAESIREQNDTITLVMERLKVVESYMRERNEHPRIQD